MFWAILALACVAPCVALAAERSVCIPPVLVIPPPGNWPGSPVLQQAQVFLVNGDRLQSSAVCARAAASRMTTRPCSYLIFVQDVCWRGMSNTYNCSLSTLQTPSDDTTDFHIEIGRVYRLTPENDGNSKRLSGAVTSRPGPDSPAATL